VSDFSKVDYTNLLDKLKKLYHWFLALDQYAGVRDKGFI
jgi:hypothetical protein